MSPNCWLIRQYLHWLCLTGIYIVLGSWCCLKQYSLSTTPGRRFIIFWPLWFVSLFTTAFVLISETVNPSKSCSCNVNCQHHWFAIGMRAYFNCLITLLTCFLPLKSSNIEFSLTLQQKICSLKQRMFILIWASEFISLVLHQPFS